MLRLLTTPGLVSGGGQSYELIRSTQSLVDRLNLNTEEISIQPVHPSIMGQVSIIPFLSQTLYQQNLWQSIYKGPSN
jgi:hypothetical protein